MARPKTVSDEDVLTAALAALADRGAEFTLTDLAERAGLARATLIQRFGDRDAILLRMAQHEVSLTQGWLDSLPIETGPGALLRFLETIVRSMDTPDGFSARVAIAALEIRDPKLRILAGKRYELVQNAIALRMPDGPQRAQAARHIHAIIAGATMQWVASEASMALGEYVMDCLQWYLDSQLARA